MLQYLGEADGVECVADACDETRQNFKNSYGVCLEDVVNPSSSCYILDSVVKAYEHNLNFDGCNTAENDAWTTAVAEVLASLAD